MLLNFEQKILLKWPITILVPLSDITQNQQSGVWGDKCPNNEISILKSDYLDVQFAPLWRKTFKAFFLLLPMLVTSMWAPLVKTKSTQHSNTDHVYVACCGLLQPHALIWANNCWTLFFILYLKHMVSGGCFGRKVPPPGFLVTRLTPLEFFPMGLCE